MIAFINAIIRHRLAVLVCSACATWGWARLIGQPILVEDYAVVTLAIGSIYWWNRLSDEAEDAVNDTRGWEDARELARGIRRTCVLCAVGAVSLSLMRGDRLGSAFVIGVLLLGLLYSSAISRGAWSLRLKDVFLVKNMTSSIGWSVLTVLYPAVHAGTPLTAEHGYAFVTMFAAVWAVELIWDIRDTEGDRSAGVRTVPVLAGTSVARYLVVGLSAASAGLILWATIRGVLDVVWLFVLMSPALTAAWTVPGRPALVESRRASHVLVMLQTFLLISLGILAGPL